MGSRSKCLLSIKIEKPMNRLIGKDQKAKDVADIEAAMAETRTDIAAGRVIKESAKEHVNRLKRLPQYFPKER